MVKILQVGLGAILRKFSILFLSEPISYGLVPNLKT